MAQTMIGRLAEDRNVRVRDVMGDFGLQEED
jgi:hypothetical protein